MDKGLILNEIKKHYNFEKDTQFANFLGIKPNTLSSWKARNSLDFELIIAKCNDISAEWLLTGKGEMLKSEIKQEPNNNNNVSNNNEESKIIKLLNIIEKQNNIIENQQNTIKDLIQQEKTPAQKNTNAKCADVA